MLAYCWLLSYSHFVSHLVLCFDTVIILIGSYYKLWLLLCSDYDPIVRHEDFRLFACMNPATDVGKKVLPNSIRNR